MKDLFRELYFGFIAILMFSEMIASNFFSLFFSIERAAEVMAVSVEIARIHLSTLVVLDAIPGIGAVLFLWAYRHGDAAKVGRFGVIVTTLGMLAYGCYQFWYATYQLGNIQGYIKLVAIVYAIFGICAWFIGGDPRRRLASPKQSMQPNPPSTNH